MHTLEVGDVWGVGECCAKVQLGAHPGSSVELQQQSYHHDSKHNDMNDNANYLHNEYEYHSN